MPTLTLTFPAGSNASAITMTAITRVDTGDSVTIDTAAFAETSPGSGVWTNTWTAPIAGLAYFWQATATIAGTDAPLSGVKSDALESYAGRYTTSTKVNTFLGTLNLDNYADTDNDDVRDAGAIEQAIVTAEGRVDLYTFGPWSFSDDLNGEVAAANFERWARVLATFELYARRVPNDSDAGKALTQWYKEAIEEMKMFAGDELELPGAIPENGDPLDDSMTLDAPIAVGPSVNPDGTNINTPYPRYGYADGHLTYG